MSLDKGREFATVHGDAKGATYWQDQLLFTEDGEVMTDHPGYSETQRKKAAFHAGLTADEGDDAPADGQLVEASGDVDLKAWAEGTIKAPFLKVRAQIQRQYSYVATNTQSAIAFLAEQGVVTLPQ